MSVRLVVWGAVAGLWSGLALGAGPSVAEPTLPVPALPSMSLPTVALPGLATPDPLKPVPILRRRVPPRPRPVPYARRGAVPLTFGPLPGSGLSVTGPDRPLIGPGAPVYTPAPIPDRDAAVPAGPRASSDPELAPGLFTRRPSYRGDAYTPNSSAQTGQDRRARPAAGLNLRLPFAPQ